MNCMQDNVAGPWALSEWPAFFQSYFRTLALPFSLLSPTMTVAWHWNATKTQGGNEKDSNERPLGQAHQKEGALTRPLIVPVGGCFFRPGGSKEQMQYLRAPVQRKAEAHGTPRLSTNTKGPNGRTHTTGARGASATTQIRASQKSGG